MVGEGGGLGSQDTLRVSGGTRSQAGEFDVVTGRSTRRFVGRLLLAASIVLVLVVAWQARAEIIDAIDVIGDLPPGVLVIGLLLEAGAVAALAQVYRAALAATGSTMGYGQGLQVSMGAFTLSRVLPGGGAAGALWAAGRLHQFGIARSKAAAAVVLEGLLAMVTLGAIVTLGGIGALFRGRVTPAGLVTVALVPAVFALVAMFASRVLRSPSARASLFGVLRRRLGERVDAWESSTDDLAEAIESGAGIWPVIGWAAVNWALDIAALWAIFKGLGLQLELGVVILGFGVANLVNALPHTPGGLGFVEAGMTGTFVALGTETSVALAAVLAYRVVSFWLPVLVGIPQYLRGPATGAVT